MDELIPEPRLGAAFAFGWRRLPAALREHWWVYLIMWVASAAVSAAYSSPGHLGGDELAGFATLPALAYAARLARPAFRLTPAILMRIMAFYVVVMLVLLFVFGGLALLAKAIPAVGVLIFGLTLVGIWIMVKLALVPTYFALHEGRAPMIKAIEDSLDVISGGMWGTIFGLGFCIGVCAALLPSILAAVVFLSFDKSGNVFALSFIAALIASAGTVLSSVWTQISLVAIATSARPQSATDSYAV